MLELIFRGFLEWIYVLLVEMWGFIANGLLSIMSLDFAYLQAHIPIIPQMSQVIMAAGWALLLGNLVFQALKSMAAGLGFEGEDPKLLFSRTFVFAFLLLASPQICRIGLDLTSNIMTLLSVPDATDVELVNEGVFGALTAAWLMAMICSVIVMFKVLGLVIEIAERYVILAMLTITAPLAFAMGGSKNTAPIFSGWCRMFGSMCLLMVTNLVCFKMLFSVLSTVPSGLDVLPWMALIFAIVKVAKKSDAIITRIGLNPAITGGPGKTLPGMLAYTVARTAVNQVVRGIGGSGGGKAAKPSPGASKSSSFFNRFGSSGMGGGRFGSSKPSGGTAGGGRYSSHSSSQQDAAQRNSATQQSTATRGSAQQNNTRQENTSRSTSQQTANANSAFHSGDQSHRGGGRGQQARRSSVPPGTRCSPSHVPPSGAASTQPAPGAAGTVTPQQSNGSRPGPAGMVSRAAPPKQPNGSQPGTAGTTARSTHAAIQTTAGSTVNNSTQTNVTAGKGTPNAPAAKVPRASHPGGAAAQSTPKPGAARSSHRDKAGAVPKTPAAPASPGVSHPDSAGKPARSTQRPSDPVSRPGRNIPPATSAPSVERTRSGTARQERTSGSSRTAASSIASSPARQEQRKPASPASAPKKSGAPSIHPGGAGTAPTGKRAASPGRTATHSSKRANSVRRPPVRNRGGAGHG